MDGQSLADLPGMGRCNSMEDELLEVGYSAPDSHQQCIPLTRWRLVQLHGGTVKFHGSQKQYLWRYKHYLARKKAAFVNRWPSQCLYDSDLPNVRVELQVLTQL